MEVYRTVKHIMQDACGPPVGWLLLISAYRAAGCGCCCAIAQWVCLHQADVQHALANIGLAEPCTMCCTMIPHTAVCSGHGVPA